MTATVGFAEFFQAAHGHRPFPWQARLADEIASSGQLPEVLDIPTGLGKTAVIDIAVWVAARTGCAAGTAGRRRTFFVIDRRIVVDEAFAHAQELAQALEGEDEACRDVAAGLRRLSGAPSAQPSLVTARMRGGASWDWRWLDRPDRPAVIVGTVDQLGSRLFFRGYGLRGELAPIDAALVGLDSLIVIDEAHMSTPLVETLQDARRFELNGECRAVAASPLVLPMSATLAAGASRVATICEADRQDPVAGDRLSAGKQLHLVRIKGSAPARAERTPLVMAELATRALTATGTQAVGVICNTVGRARQVFDHLRSDELAGGSAELHLLTGRVRPWDRDRIRDEVWPLAGAKRQRASAPPAIVVATQTVEVGANLDFDALVTESASWDALIQRLGRLNRLGNLESSPAIVVHDDTESLLYGQAREATWSFLCAVAPVMDASRAAPDLANGPGVGPDAVAELTSDVDVSALRLAPPASPTLLPTHLDTWAQTSPQPVTDVPVAPFLHGYDTGQPEVHLVWRSDLEASSVSALPPAADERLTISLRAFRAWIRSPRTSEAGDLTDLIGLDSTDTGSDPDPANPVDTHALLWDPSGEPELVFLPRQLSRVGPDCVVILPTAVGGCDRFGWSPGSTERVPDIADMCGRQPMLRMSPADTLHQTIDTVLNTTLPDGVSDEIDDDVSRALVDRDSDLLATAGLRVWESLPVEAQRALLRLSAKDPDPPAPRVSGVLVDREASRSGLVRFAPSNEKEAGRDLRFSSDSVDDPAGTSYSSGQVTLEAHQNAVASRARSIAQSLGLSQEQAESVVVAAAWHDVGKLDHRFQTMLNAGDDLAAEVALVTGQALAKSGMDPADRANWRQAYRASGLPRDFRHEVGSAAAVRAAVEGRGDLDVELVVHLVASHHGRSRPLFPPVEDTAPSWTLAWNGMSVEHEPSCSVDWAAPRRFQHLNQRYGRWGLAMLETVVRLADIGCSEEGK